LIELIEFIGLIEMIEFMGLIEFVEFIELIEFIGFDREQLADRNLFGFDSGRDFQPCFTRSGRYPGSWL
jgi:hypothetical protein